MGPSHTFFLLLVISAYALGMLPQDPSTQPNNAGSPTNSGTSATNSAFATPPGSSTGGQSTINIPNDISSFLNGAGASGGGGTGGAGGNPGAQPTMPNPYPTLNNFYQGQPTKSPYPNQYQNTYSAQAQYGSMYAGKTPNMYGQQPPQTMQNLYAQAAQYGQKPMYGQTPKYGQQTPMYGQQTSGMYGQQNSMYRTQTPGFGQQYTMYGQQPVYGQRTPMYGSQPSYGQYSPYPNSPYGTTRNPWSSYPWQQQQGSGTTTGPTSNQGQTTTKPVNGFVAHFQLQRKESWNSKLMSHYKNQYGCVEALKYIPAQLRFQYAGEFYNGCGARSNMTCNTATMNRNPRVFLNRRFMSPQRLKQIETALNYMDLYTAFGERAKQTSGQSGNAAMSSMGGAGAMGAMGPMGGAGAMGAMGPMGGAGAMGAMGAMGTMGGAGAMGAMGAMPGAMSSGMPGGMFGQMAMPGGGGRPGGIGGMLGGALIMSEIAGMEVSEARENFLPYQCQEMGIAPQTKIGMCCPGAVEILPQHQAAIGLRGAM